MAWLPDSEGIYDETLNRRTTTMPELLWTVTQTTAGAVTLTVAHPEAEDEPLGELIIPAYSLEHWLHECQVRTDIEP